MTELEQARANLRLRQELLAFARRRRPLVESTMLRAVEGDVLAALSWVWDAQERAGYRVSMAALPEYTGQSFMRPNDQLSGWRRATA